MRKFHRDRCGALLALFLATMVLAACGGDSTDVGTGASEDVAEGGWEEVVAAANEEGLVSLYSVAPPPQNDRLVAAFNEAYPDIDVTVTRGAGELPPRVEQEIQSGSGGADVFMYSDPAFFVKHADNLLDVEGPNVEGWAEDYWAVPDKAIIPTKYPWTQLVWNAQTFPDGFENWDDLLEPDVQGKLAVYKVPTTSNCSTLNFMERELGEDFLTDLGQQDAKYYPSTVPMVQAIASGEAGVGYLAAPISVADLQAQGAPVELAYPEPGFALMWGGGAIATSDRPNAARVFIDFVMSEEGQEALNGDGLGAAGREGIPGALDDLEGWELFDAEACSTPEAIAEAERKLNTYFP
jgi:iron(III) transport system substrate-binding protein